MQSTISITCTCTHGGGGHAERCALFVPSVEAYTEVRRQRDAYREELRRVLNEVRPMSIDEQWKIRVALGDVSGPISAE